MKRWCRGIHQGNSMALGEVPGICRAPRSTQKAEVSILFTRCGRRLPVLLGHNCRICESEERTRCSSGSIHPERVESSQTQNFIPKTYVHRPHQFCTMFYARLHFCQLPVFAFRSDSLRRIFGHQAPVSIIQKIITWTASCARVDLHKILGVCAV